MSESNSPSEAFVGVRFVLHGFDSINQHQVRSKLAEGGGVDVGQYGQNCTHVIVDQIVYDDPICVAARNDGKTLVTTLWVDHSFDVGMLVDATSIMYRPLKDLKGIPGAQSLVMCLTGYQRQDREDIMTMASLMGAQFTKSLLANKVTHLICYKFEGEKYDLAKKIKRIKLVNHHWLEDCLRDWEILPEANYTKSGYELEMETEAMDSEEEAENTTVKQLGGPNIKKSPQNLSIEMPRALELPKSVGKGSIVLSDSTALKGPLNFVNLKDRSPTPIEENTSHRISSSNVTEILDNQKTGAFGGAGCGELPNPHDRTPDSAKVRNDLASTSRCAERPLHSDAEFSARSYSRRTLRRSSLSLYLGEISNDPRECTKVCVGEFNINDVSKVSPSKVEQENDRLGSGCIEAPPKGTDIHHEQESSGMLPQKRKTDISPGSFKLKKTSPEAKQSIVGIPSASNKCKGSEATFLTEMASNHISLGNDGHSKDMASNLNTGNSPGSVSTTKPSSSNKKSLICDLPLSKKMTSESGQVDNTNEKSPETSGRLRKLTLASEPDFGDFGMGGSTHLTGETQKPQNQQQDVKVSSPGNRESETEKSLKPANLELLEGRTGAKPLRKRTLGSRPKLSNTVKQKGSIYIREGGSNSDAANSLGQGKVTGDSKLNKLVISPPNVNVKTKDVETKEVIKSGDDDKNTTDFMDDETEAPEDKDEHEFGKVLNKDKSVAAELSNNADVMMKDKSEGVHNKTNNSKDGVHDDAMVLEEGANGAEIENTVSDKHLKVGGLTSRGDGVKKKTNKGKKRNSGETTMKVVPAAVEIMKPKKGVAGKKTQNVKNMKMGMQKEKKVLCPASKTKSGAVSVNKSEKSIEVEKENKPVADGVQNNSQETHHEGKSAVKSTKTLVKIDQKAVKINHNSKLVGEVPGKQETEPVWFILSGHKLQKKEFQQVIRRLKGKICRDSHQWSYQATHFIAPDPIKRIEKFFAAAASGRWILKTDYLTASCQAGRFLAEEPYEWHKNGLSEDGAINLEAPRKWRLLRERTHHGAFYKMRIIIYGECIAPPLDTLKRVVKSGDGTILATSPPYTRFLNTGVDFAVVSPGMPRVDMWVQEFLKHEIPCVVADYLVEYVCKPGYSLDRHVLYNTHAWAAKSYANLLSRGEEIIEDFTPPENFSSDDLICDVCRSSDRGEVMLICSNESGSLGCGIGTHIDCCDPPLEAVPEEDWFCPNCSRSSSSKGSSKSGKKRTALKGK